MELGVGEALTSFLDENGVPAMVERTKIICPQSLMAPPEPMVRAKVMMHDGMEKYDDFVDNVSAYEVLSEEADRKAQEKAEAEAEKQRLKEEEADRKRQLKLEDEARRRQQKLADEERRRQQKLADEARRKAERQQEKLEAEAKRKAERRAAKIESQLISAGGQVLKRGLLGVLKKR